MDTMTEPATTITADRIRDALLATRHIRNADDIVFAAPVRREGDGWIATVDLPNGVARAVAADEQVGVAESLGVAACQVILSWLPTEPRRLHVWVGDRPTTWVWARRDIDTYFGLSYSNYLVLHRTLLQSMPESWQHKFVSLLDDLGQAFAHVEQAGDLHIDMP